MRIEADGCFECGGKCIGEYKICFPCWAFKHSRSVLKYYSRNFTPSDREKELMWSACEQYHSSRGK